MRYGFWPFWSQIGYGVRTLVFNWVCSSEEAILPNKGGLKQGIDLRVRSEIEYRIFSEVINRENRRF